MHEALTVARWLTATLGDPELTAALGGPGRIHHGPADHGEPHPLVTFDFGESPDVTAVGTHRLMTGVEVIVKVVDASTSFARAAAAEAIVDRLLQGTHNAPVGAGYVLTMERRAAIAYPERTDGLAYAHVGGRWTATVTERTITP